MKNKKKCNNDPNPINNKVGKELECCECCGAENWKVIEKYYDEFGNLEAKVLQCVECLLEVTDEFDG
jgi:hypothetical protein